VIITDGAWALYVRLQQRTLWFVVRCYLYATFYLSSTIFFVCVELSVSNDQDLIAALVSNVFFH
jgi:hypothetical protein